MEAATAYVPMDRRQALASGRELPEQTKGAALFADISGFTPLTAALARELGPRRGADELTVHLNRVYSALIAELHRNGGSVISFGGDAIICWLDGDDGYRATACALAMQRAMRPFAEVKTAGGSTVSMAMKAAVAAGPARRFLVGDPTCCLIEVVAGQTLERLAVAGEVVGRGEVILAPPAAEALESRVLLGERRLDPEQDGVYALVSGLVRPAPDSPWPKVSPEALREVDLSPWLLPPVYHQLESGQGEFLAELRPCVALFLSFGGIDYDRDPTAARKLDTFVRGAQNIVRRYEGSLLQLSIGDKGSYLYVAFGAPIAHENDAERAASAALDLQKLADDLDYLTDVQIGISQGRMRAGAYGSRTRRTYGVLGDVVNLAARLMTSAAPGQILVTDRARHAAGGSFTWDQLDPKRVKGKRETVALSRLVGRRRQRTIHLLEPTYSLPMVGRQAELELVKHRVGQALQGEGQIIGIVAEAGMGKSRLAAEAIRLAQAQGLLGFGGECQSHGTSTSYLVWRSIWRGLFDLDPTEAPGRQIGALEHRLNQIDPGLASRLPLLGSVLNLPIPDSTLTGSLDAKVRKSSLEALLIDCLRARAAEHPVLLVLEDCHWLDPLSHDLIKEVGRAIVDLPVLMLLVYRPPDVGRPQQQGLGQLPHFHEVELAEFTLQEAERLIRLKLERFFGTEAEVSQSFVTRIADRAAGNPFYIEELLNYLQDRGIHPQDTQALAGFDLPSSLHTLVLSRIDQLAESQQTTIKVASVIGRLFQAAMLWGVYPQLGSVETIKANLEVLDTLDLTPLDTPEPELTYLFKHIVTQEVAYKSLLYATRAKLHGGIGRYLERTHAQNLDQVLNLLAYHFEHSDSEPEKRKYLLWAGQVAQADYANEAAIEYYEKVLPLLPPADQIPVLLKLGIVLELTGQWKPAEKRFGQGLQLAKEMDDELGQAKCEAATGELFRKQGEYAKASDWLERARTHFEELGNESGTGQVLHFAGTLADQQGDTHGARALYQKSLAVRRRLDDKAAIGALLSNLGIVAFRQGEHEIARDYLEESLAVRREIDDRWAIAVTLNNIGFLALDLGQLSEARSRLQEALSLQREVGDRWMIGNALNNLGNAAREQGDLESAQSLYDESLVIYRVLGDKWALAYLFEDTGSLAALEGQPRRALRLIGAASTLREEIGAPLTPTERGKLEAALEPAREALDDEDQAFARAAGKAMSLDDAIQEALASP